ncbi:MAG: alanine--glyoxylate aminotransferase family protein [Nitrospirae bacterium]|nr:MAG: alanine--glyoxylate aminotransferase family protein [Nitrospirota bacterium]
MTAFSGEAMILLNPGPVNISERVRRALTRPDLCHREPECAELLARIRHKLLQAFVPGHEAEYTAILLTGSGTAAVEACLLSCLPPGKRLLIVNNGVYGQRLMDMASLQRLAIPDLKYEWTCRPDPETIRVALTQHPEVQAVALVHHETTVGLINPVHEIAEVVDNLGRVCIVDSVSGLGGEPLDIAGRHIYLVAGTAGKCIQGVPGVSFVLARKGFMERARHYQRRSWYLSLARYYEAQEQGSVPCTPAIQVLFAFDEALTELLEEGVANRIKRYGQAAALIRERMQALGVRPVLPASHQSHSLTAFYMPEGISYQTLHDQLKARGFVIYAGQGHLESTIFRIANMGALTENDVAAFLDAFQDVLEHHRGQA